MLLDAARCYGYELVMPPLLEHIESLLTGTGRLLDLKTFKLVDQLSGRTLGVRADTTPQVARIDAHLLNREGVTRLCYCGPVLHTRPAGLHATREPLQLGAEIYGHAGLEADLEALELAVDALARAGVSDLVVDLADARILSGLIDARVAPGDRLDALQAALGAKDREALARLCHGDLADLGEHLVLLTRLYGDAAVLDEARHRLPAHPLVRAALDDLTWLSRHLAAAHPGLRIGFDLADVSGYSYYTGARFSVYAGSGGDALVRGGRYDDVGSVFGRRRAAVGFSLDLKMVVAHARFDGRRTAVRAPWGEAGDLQAAVRKLREAGETVVCVLPGHEHEVDEFECDRELVQQAGQWTVRAR